MRYFSIELLTWFLISRLCAFGLPCTSVCGGISWNYNECDISPGSDGEFNTTFTGNSESLTNQYTTDSSAKECDLGSRAKDFSLRLRPTKSALFSITTDGSVYDTTLQVINCKTGEILQCDDDAGPGLTSLILTRLEHGTDYLVIVDAYSSGNQGPFNLNVASIPWPSEDICPGIDNIASFPETSDDVVQLYSTRSFSMSQVLNMTMCGTRMVNETGNLTEEPYIESVRSRPESVGLIAKTSGLYSFTACPENIVLSPHLCKANQSLSDSCAINTGSIWLDSGDRISFLAANQDQLSLPVTGYSVFGVLNKTVDTPYCDRCRPIVAQHSALNSTARPSPRTFLMKESVDPLTNETYFGDTYFYIPPETGLARLGVCGALNGNVTVLTCDGTIVGEGRIGYGLEFNVTMDSLYVIQVKAKTSSDRGPYRIFPLTRVECCSSEVYGAGFNERFVKGYPAEIGASSFVVSLFALVTAMAISARCMYPGSNKEFMKSATCSVFALGVIAFIPSLYFAIAYSGLDNPPSIRVFSIYWITSTCLVTAALLYHVTLYDWTIAFGPGMFYRADEQAVNVRLFIAVFALCTIFSMSIPGFVILARTDNFNSLFTFCAEEGQPCLGLSEGYIVQKLFATSTVGRAENGTIQYEGWNSDLTYESILADDIPFVCEASPEELNYNERPLCSDTCTLNDDQGESLTNNGQCNDLDGADCYFGTDCTE